MAYGRDRDRDRGDIPPLEGQAYIPEEQPAEQSRIVIEPRKPHKKVSWVAALVAGLVVVFIVAVLMLATLFTNYRRGTKLEKVINGSEKVEINIYTSEEAMKSNGVDLFDSQDKVQQVVSEMGVPRESVKVTIYLTDRMIEPEDETEDNTGNGTSSSSNGGTSSSNGGTSSSSSSNDNP